MSVPQSDPSSGHDRTARRFLRQRHKELLDVLNLEEVMVQLYSDEVLDTQVQEKLMNPSFGARNKLQELLLYLTRQGEPGLLALIRALKECGDDPSQSKLGQDLEQQYHTFLSANSSIGSTESSSIVSSNRSRRTSDLDELSDSSYPRAPIHVGPLDWRPQNPKHIKIVVIGPPGSGKTSFMLRYTRGCFDILNPRSKVVEFSSKHYMYDGLEYLLEFHDTPGHNRYDSIVAQYWRNTHGALVIYDITSQQSLAEALEWKKYLDKVIIQQDGKCIPAVLIGNKHDKMEQNKQGFEAPLGKWKQPDEFIEFFATSVKTEYNVAKSVEFLVEKILVTGIPSTHYLPDYRTPKIEQIANPTTNESTKCCQ